MANVNLHKICAALAPLRVLNKSEKCIHHVVRCYVIPSFTFFLSIQVELLKAFKASPSPHSLHYSLRIPRKSRKETNSKWRKSIGSTLYAISFLLFKHCYNPSVDFVLLLLLTSSLVPGLGTEWERKLRVHTRCMALHASVFPFQRASKQHVYPLGFFFLPHWLRYIIQFKFISSNLSSSESFLSSTFVELKN